MGGRLGDAEFEALRALLGGAVGLVFDDSRRDSLAFSISGRLEATGCADVASYLTLLASPRGLLEMQWLVDAVTIQETHFFRNPPQIRALRQHVLPELVRRVIAGDRQLTIWSAGCSTGEEPYSLSILLHELLPMVTPEQVRILATDVSAGAVAFAEQGRYGLRTVQLAETVDIDRWFVPDGDSFRVRDEVRELVEFQRHNLVTEPPPFGPGEVDLLLCRNVTIYFNRDTTKALMGRFHAAMAPGGYLFLGHSETLWQMSDDFTLVTLGDAFLYRKDVVTPATTVAAIPAGGVGLPGVGRLAQRRLEATDRHGDDQPPITPNRRLKIERRRKAAVPAARTSVGSLPRPVLKRTLSSTPIVVPLAEIAEATARGTPQGVGVTAAAAPATLADPASGTARAAAVTDAPLSEADAGLLARARSALREGRYEDAVAAAAAVAYAEPLLADAHLVAGEALTNLGRSADAMVELRKAVYIDPNCAQAHLLLAGALDRLGERAAAARSYRAAAATFGSLPPEEAVSMFGGRRVTELVELCVRLAAQAERAAGT